MRVPASGPGNPAVGPATVRTSRRALLAGLVSASGAALAGCSSVPTRGPVQQVAPRVEQTTDTSVRIDAQGPRAGARPAIIVEGFLNAIASLEPGFATARQYLTDAARAAWDPAAGTTITTGQPLTATATSQVLVAPLVGQLDADGRFTPRSGTLRHDFGLQRVRGEWRIATPPVGLLISQATFASYHTTMTRWFVSRDDHSMVPETLHVPQDTLTPALALKALFDGPSPWLAHGVQTGAPDTPRADAAPRVQPDGTIDVDLPAPWAGLPAEQRTRLGLQVAWTLQQFPGLTRVQLTAAGQPFAAGSLGTGAIGLSGVLPRSPLQAAGGQVLTVVSGGRLGQLSGSMPTGQFQAAPGQLARCGAVGASGFATMDSGMRVVWRDAGGTSMATAHGSIRVLAGPGWGTPQAGVDAQGTATWVGVLQGRHPALARVSDTGRPVVTPLTGLPAGTVRDFSLSPDASRLAVIVQAADTSMLGLLAMDAGSGRTAGWSPVLQGGASGAPGDLRQVVWTGSSRLAVLGATSPRAVGTVFQVSDDGSSLSALGPAPTTSITGIDAVPALDQTLQLYALTAQEALLRCDDAWRWTQVARAISAVSLGQ